MRVTPSKQTNTLQRFLEESAVQFARGKGRAAQRSCELLHTVDVKIFGRRASALTVAAQRFSIKFDDPDQMPERMSSVAKNFTIRPERGGSFESSLTATRVRDVALFDISMTAARVISADRLGYFSINLPYSRALKARVAGKVETFARDEAYVAKPEEPFDLRFRENSGCFVVNVFKPQLDDYAVAMQGGKRGEVLDLANRLQLALPAGQALQRYLSFLWSEMRRSSPLLESDLVVEELEKALLTSLLFAADPMQRNTDENVPSAYLHRAVDFIMTHLSAPLSLGAISTAAGVHARTLQRAFNECYGMSVMRFARERRLERAHEKLLAVDDPATSVTDVALENGFWHLGRFSAVYRQRFGESPAGTLRRSKLHWRI